MKPLYKVIVEAFQTNNAKMIEQIEARLLPSELEGFGPVRTVITAAGREIKLRVHYKDKFAMVTVRPSLLGDFTIGTRAYRKGDLMSLQGILGDTLTSKVRINPLTNLLAEVADAG